MQLPLDLTIAIPTRNEAQHLPACLEAIGKDFAKQVFIIDSGSIDATIAIATDWGAKPIPFKWNGQFPKKRNWFLRNHTPQTEWVLFLDADEYLTKEFKQELRQAIHQVDKAGYWLRYSIFFEGKKLKGGYPLHKLALFRTGAGEYERIEEQHWSDLDMEIHEHPVLNGPIGTILAKIEHRDDRGVEHYRDKHLEYARWEASRYQQSKNDPAIRKQWTLKQRIKYALMATPFLSPAYFLGTYFLMLGFIDGANGFKFARLKANYFRSVSRQIRLKLTNNKFVNNN